MTDPRSAVVIGGANVDLKARSLEPLRMRSSNPGHTTISPGGVARNVAENIARLGSTVHLVAAVGRDALGDRLLADTAAAGVRVDHVVRGDRATGTYVAVLDSNGEMTVAVADMTATDSMRPVDLQGLSTLIANAGLLLLDANLHAELLSHLIEMGHRAGVPTALDPVSQPKARPLAAVLHQNRPLFMLTPNLGELEVITSRGIEDDTALVAAASALHQMGVQHVWVRLGARGSLLSTLDGHAMLPAVPAAVVDVTGAGDSMLGAFAHRFLQGASLVDAARAGHAAAALTVASELTVRTDLTPELIDATLEAAGLPEPTWRSS